MGIKQKIQKATSEVEIDMLLSQGKSYEWASEDTKRKWRRAAEKRKSELR